jgi:hypothetical protein
MPSADPRSCSPPRLQFMESRQVSIGHVADGPSWSHPQPKPTTVPASRDPENGHGRQAAPFGSSGDITGLLGGRLRSIGSARTGRYLRTEAGCFPRRISRLLTGRRSRVDRQLDLTECRYQPAHVAGSHPKRSPAHCAKPQGHDDNASLPVRADPHCPVAVRGRGRVALARSW